MCVIVKNMLFFRTNILHFRERISLMKMYYFQRIWQIMLFLYMYQIQIIQFWTSKWSCVWNVMQTIEPNYLSIRVGRKKLNLYFFPRFLILVQHMEIDNLNIKLLTSCNKNVVYRGITQTILLDAFSDLADAP